MYQQPVPAARSPIPLSAYYRQQPLMVGELPTAFFSYARVDAEVVRLFARELDLAGIGVFLDLDFLRPGERFETAILGKVRSASALVFFASPSSLQSKWMERELLAFSKASSRPIFAVLINGASYNDLQGGFAVSQAVPVQDDSAIPVAVSQLAAALSLLPSRGGELSREAERRAAQLADGIAADIRAPARDPEKVANSVFLVHGTDHAFRDEVARYLDTLGIRPVILAQEHSERRLLLDKFESLATQAIFAVVLMSPDDYGAQLEAYCADQVGERALKYRARENVILELGFFYGRLGWENVFVLKKPANQPWPEFEGPSDLHGTNIYETTGELDWRGELAGKLREAKLLEPQ